MTLNYSFEEDGEEYDWDYEIDESEELWAVYNAVAEELRYERRDDNEDAVYERMAKRLEEDGADGFEVKEMLKAALDYTDTDKLVAEYARVYNEEYEGQIENFFEEDARTDFEHRPQQWD